MNTRQVDPQQPSSGSDSAARPDSPPVERSDIAKDKTWDPLRRSRTSGAWVGIVALGAILLLLVVFIAQNTQSVEVSFLGWEGDVPLSVALLIAAVAGLLVTAAAGSLRIWQLRRRVRRLERAHEADSNAA